MLTPLEIGEARIESTAQTEIVRGEALLLNRPLASLIAGEHVCVYCLIQSISGMEGAHPIERHGAKKNDMARETELLCLITQGSRGAAEARAHNREMRTLKGNIHFIVDYTVPRTDVVASCNTKALWPIKHNHSYQLSVETKHRVIQKELPACIYGPTTSAGIALTNVPPTRHQLSWLYQSLVGDPDNDDVPQQEAGLGPSQEGRGDPDVVSLMAFDAGGEGGQQGEGSVRTAVTALEAGKHGLAAAAEVVTNQGKRLLRECKRIMGGWRGVHRIATPSGISPKQHE